MLKEFIKYDKESIHKVTISIQELNRILSENRVPVKILSRHEETSSFCKLSVENNGIVPAEIAIGNLLGISIKEWYWSENGYGVCLEYQVKKENKK